MARRAPMSLHEYDVQGKEYTVQELEKLALQLLSRDAARARRIQRHIGELRGMWRERVSPIGRIGLALALVPPFFLATADMPSLGDATPRLCTALRPVTSVLALAAMLSTLYVGVRLFVRPSWRLVKRTLLFLACMYACVAHCTAMSLFLRVSLPLHLALCGALYSHGTRLYSDMPLSWIFLLPFALASAAAPHVGEAGGLAEALVRTVSLLHTVLPHLIDPVGVLLVLALLTAVGCLVSMVGVLWDCRATIARRRWYVEVGALVMGMGAYVAYVGVRLVTHWLSTALGIVYFIVSYSAFATACALLEHRLRARLRCEALSGTTLMAFVGGYTLAVVMALS